MLQTLDLTMKYGNSGGDCVNFQVCMQFGWKFVVALKRFASGKLNVLFV